MSLPKGSFIEDIYREDWNTGFDHQKSAQSQISEFAIVSKFAQAELGWSHFYMLPTIMISNRFVTNRIDKMVERVPYYKAKLKTDANNKSLKIYGGAALAYTGSNSSQGMVEFSADVVTIDEYDKCNPENIDLAMGRLLGSDIRIVRSFSHPTHNGVGINGRILKTNMLTWFVHTDCGHWVNPDWFRDFVTPEGKPRNPDILPLCPHCGKPYNQRNRGKWDAIKPENQRKGRLISGIYASKYTNQEAFDWYKDGLENESVMQQFYNLYLGLPYTPEGSQVSKNLLDGCIDPEYLMPSSFEKGTLMGLDMNKKMTHHILFRNDFLQKYDSVSIGYSRTRADVDELIRKFSVKILVVDAMPELQFVNSLKKDYPFVWSCQYGKAPNDVKASFNTKDRIITINRTFEMDEVKTVVFNKMLRFPKNIEKIEDFYEHMQAPIRTYDEKKEVYSWVEGSHRDDHFHSLLYALQAKRLQPFYNPKNQVQDIPI